MNILLCKKSREDVGEKNTADAHSSMPSFDKSSVSMILLGHKKMASGVLMRASKK
jgi:hypothetical protein